MRLSAITLSLLAVLLLISVPADADPVLLAVGGTPDGSARITNSQWLGVRFSVTDPIFVDIAIILGDRYAPSQSDSLPYLDVSLQKGIGPGVGIWHDTLASGPITPFPQDWMRLFPPGLLLEPSDYYLLLYGSEFGPLHPNERPYDIGWEAFASGTETITTGPGISFGGFLVSQGSDQNLINPYQSTWRPFSGFMALQIYSTTEPHPPPIPEPSTLALLGIGIVGLIGYDWRHRKR